MVKNIDSEKSNDSNYKQIEKILNKKNKELKDLYLQGDYIVKPEYLEWQVFFSAFYAERRKGDNTLNNADYYSDPDKKPTKPIDPQPPIDVNIGLAIPVKDIEPRDRTLAITLPNEINITPAVIDIPAPTASAIIAVNPLQFQPIYPSIPQVTVSTVTPISFDFPGSSNSDDQYFLKQSASVAPISQQNLTGQGSGGSMDVISNSSTLNQDFDIYVQNTHAVGVSNGATHKLTDNGIQNTSATGLTSDYAAMKLVGGHTVNIENMNFRMIGVGNKPGNYLMLFHTDAHDDGGEAAAWIMDSSTTTKMYGQQVIFYGVQSHKTYTYGADMINNGTIEAVADTSVVAGGGTINNLTPQQRIIFTTIDANSGNLSYYNRYFTFTNNNGANIVLNGTSDILANYATPGNTNGGAVFTNNGNVTLNGLNSIGVILNSSVSGFGDSKIIFNTPVVLNGDNSVGIQATNSMINLDNSVIKLNIGTAGNAANSTGNASGGDASKVENAIGVAVDYTTSNPLRMSNYNIFLGSSAKGSTGVMAQNGTITLGYNSAAGTTQQITSNGGIKNNLLVATGSGSSITTEANTTLSILNGFGQVGIFANDGATVNNAGTLNASGAGTIGVIINDGTVTNTGNLNISGGVYTDPANDKTGTVGVAVLSTGGSPASFTSASGNIQVNVTGQESTGLFTDSGLIDITGGNIEASDSAFNLYSKGAAGVIKLNGTTLRTGQRSLLFYTEDGGTFDLTNVTATIAGGTDSSSRGTAFYYSGNNTPLTKTDLENYFQTTFNGLAGKLTLNMEAGSRLFIVDNIVMDLSTAATPLGSLANGPTVVGSNYKTYMMYKGTLNIDQNVNLDSPTDPYNTLELATSHINNTSATFSGTKAGQIGMAQENGLDSLGVSLPRNQVTLVNNGGTFNLSGSKSVGIYASNGEISNINSGNLTLTGDGSIGMYAVNGTMAINDATSNITIGTNGIGIYAEGFKQGSSQAFGNGTLDITNNGNITAQSGSGAIGIYLNNNSTGVRGDTKLDISGGNIDVQNSVKGVGVYMSGGTLTSTSSTIISVGENGIGLYVKNSDVNLSDITLNLNGDNALGIYFDGGTNFTGAGTFNIDGKNVVLYNMVSGGVVNANISLGTVTTGSSYIFGSVIDQVAVYTGDANLASNGSFLIGKNSAVYLSPTSSITVQPGSVNTSAFVLDGQYVMPAGSSAYAGMTPDMDGENAGVITVADSSAGIYGKNGSRLINTGTITVGNYSAAVTSSGAGSQIINTGTINLGSRSNALFLKDGVNIENRTSGVITGSSDHTIALFADNVSGPIINQGTITLTGDQSAGIYSMGSAAKTINNSGTINIGNSLDVKNPSVGIFTATAGDQITNNNLNAGNNSIGIYSVGGQITQTGTLNIGDTGAGMYLRNGLVNITNTAALNFGTDKAVGVYADNSTVLNNANMNIGNNNFGFVVLDGSYSNTASDISMGSDSIYLVKGGSGTVTNASGTTVTMNGSRNTAFYILNRVDFVNDGTITGTAGTSNIGVHSIASTVTNNGSISLGDSNIIFKKNFDGSYSLDPNGNKIVDIERSLFTVGMYGNASTLINTSTGNITVGAGGVGIGLISGSARNDGNITANGAYSMGMYTERGSLVNNGTINVTGDNVIGMAGNGEGSKIENYGTIKVSGTHAIGMYGLSSTEIINGGTIIADGEGAQGIVLGNGSVLNNLVGGTIIINGGVGTGNYGVGSGEVYNTPTIINAGVIKVAEKFTTDGVNVVINVDPSTIKAPTAGDIAAGNYDPTDLGADYLISNAVSIQAPAFDITSPLQVSGNFAVGTNVEKYKLEDVIIPGSGFGADSASVPIQSKSLTWKAIPVVNSRGNLDVWMEKIPYDNFTSGLWYQDFGRALDEKYYKAEGDALKIYDRLDVVENELDFRHLMASLAGDVYANINQREEDIARTLESSLDLLQNSKNNTKENVKIDVIVGKGENKENTDGVQSYNYTTAGVLALREVERTYRHTFGYSLGYLHTGFEFNDGNNSEEWVDTIQLGVHNKYTADSWKVKNDLTGRVSFHNVDRNVDWGTQYGRSEMNGTYETYSITSDNILGKEFELSKKVTITPYGGLRAMYVTRPTFDESGLEAVQVEGNDAWSVKPRAGVELKASMPLSPKTEWKLKGTLDLAYEYELANLNEREKARLTAIETDYHNLSKPMDENGAFRSKASLGVEVENRYGIFLTGEYVVGNDNQDDYRAGVSLKAVF
ncbi:autotransporter domain-containing protein [Sebaldella sp. S0638]|nr:autotransporter domain-containing protein [Sebaldella sp. S0638]